MSKESIFDTRMNGPLLLDPGAEVADPRHEKYAGAGIDVSTGVVDARSALALADAASAAILLPPGATLRVASDLVLSGEIRAQGGVLQPDNGVTVTINGSFSADLYRCFDTSLGGTVTFGDGTVEEFRPQWWGAVGDGLTDDSAAVQAAMDAAYRSAAANATVRFPHGTWRINAITPRHGVTVKGAGKGIFGTVLLSRNAGSMFTFASLVDARFEDICFSATVAGVSAFRQSNLTEYTARCTWERCQFRTELEECLYFNPIFARILECEFGVNGSPTGVQHRAVYARGDVLGNTANINIVRDCIVNSAYGVGAEAAMVWDCGQGLRIENTDFESNTNRALDLLGMRNVSVSHCWFEGNAGVYQVRLARDTASSSVNQNVTSFHGCTFNLKSVANVAIFDIAALGAELSEFVGNTLTDTNGTGLTRYITHVAGVYNERIVDYYHNEPASGVWSVPTWRLRSSASAWNNGSLRMGDYFLWIDAADRLRLAPNEPTSAVDGTPVGGAASVANATASPVVFDLDTLADGNWMVYAEMQNGGAASDEHFRAVYFFQKHAGSTSKVSTILASDAPGTGDGLISVAGTTVTISWTGTRFGSVNVQQVT